MQASCPRKRFSCAGLKRIFGLSRRLNRACPRPVWGSGRRRDFGSGFAEFFDLGLKVWASRCFHLGTARTARTLGSQHSGLKVLLFFLFGAEGL